jgi:hypothetical protein
MKTVPVSAHTRRLPEKAPDPFAPVMAARRKDFARKWNVQLIGTDDPRLSVPIPEPVEGGMSNTWIIERIRQLAEMMARIGRD